MATMPPLGDCVSAVCDAGDLVDGTGILGDSVGTCAAAIGACDVGASVYKVDTWNVVGIGVVAHTAIWHCTELGTHGCPSSRQKTASTDDSTPCTTIVHVAVDVDVPSPHVAVQADCSCCTHHSTVPTAADTAGLRWARRTGLTLHS